MSSDEGNTVRERVAKNEVKISAIEHWLKGSLDTFNQRLETVIEHSNHDLTNLSVIHKEDTGKMCKILDKQQKQIEAILGRCAAHDIEAVKMKLTNKVLYILGGAIVAGFITFGFEFFRKLVFGA